MTIFSYCSPLLHSGNPLSKSQSPSLPFIHLPFLSQFFFFIVHLVSPIFNGSSHCLLFLVVESCQILFKIKALFIQPLNHPSSHDRDIFKDFHPISKTWPPLPGPLQPSFNNVGFCRCSPAIAFKTASKNASAAPLLSLNKPDVTHVDLLSLCLS